MQWLEAEPICSCRYRGHPVYPQQRPGERGRGAGRLQVNGEGDYPFVVWATDGGRPGSALDRIEIEVNTPTARDGAQGDPATIRSSMRPRETWWRGTSSG